MYKIAYIGSKLDAPGMKALGIDVRECDRTCDVPNTLKELAKSGKYAVILISSQLAAEVPAEDIEKLKTRRLSIVPIPGSGGNFDLIQEEVSGLTKGAIGKEIKISS